MKIRVDTGAVEFEKGHVGPLIDKRAFLASSIGERSEAVISNGPFETRRFFPEVGIAATASFMNDRLSGVTLMMQMPTDKDRLWTEELERKRKGIHDDWLRAELGEPPYRYDWGDISSAFDPKGCVSDIILSYAA
jgi:hypothetical protein